MNSQTPMSSEMNEKKEKTYLYVKHCLDLSDNINITCFKIAVSLFVAWKKAPMLNNFHIVLCCPIKRHTF